MEIKPLSELQKYLHNHGLQWDVVVASEADDPIDVAVLVPPQPGLDNIYAQLLASYQETGWWPVQTDGHNGDLDRPWGDGELEGPAEIPSRDNIFQEDILDGLYVDDDEYLEDAQFPPYSEKLRDELIKHWNTSYTDTLATIDVELFDNNGLLIVPTHRPADVPGLLGWLGPCNYGLSGASISTILRNWEDRFGAVLFKLDFDCLYLQVADIDLDEDTLALTALEHHVFCADNIDQGTGNFGEYVPKVAERYWAFWWD